MVDFAITPTRTALINVDMQNCFVEGHPNTPQRLETLERINHLAAACRAANIPVIHTSHILRPDGSNIGILGEVVPRVRLTGFLHSGTVTATLHPHLTVEPSDILLEKPRFGAFHGTDLELILRARGIDTVIIAGIDTCVCCDTTAREANARDFRVLFLSDGTATSTTEAQEATLKTIGAVFGQVLTVEDALEKIRSGCATTVTA